MVLSVRQISISPNTGRRVSWLLLVGSAAFHPCVGVCRLGPRIWEFSGFAGSINPHKTFLRRSSKTQRGNSGKLSKGPT